MRQAGRVMDKLVAPGSPDAPAPRCIGQQKDPSSRTLRVRRQRIGLREIFQARIAQLTQQRLPLQEVPRTTSAIKEA